MTVYKRAIKRDKIPVSYPPTTLSVASAFRKESQTIRKSGELTRLPRVSREVYYSAESVENYARRRGYEVVWIDPEGRQVDPVTGAVSA